MFKVESKKVIALFNKLNNQFFARLRTFIADRSFVQLIKDYQAYLLSIVITVLLISIFNAPSTDRFLISVIYLLFAYLFFIGLLFSYFKQQHSETNLIKPISFWFNEQRNMITVIIFICLALILNNISQIRFFYNITLILAYALLFFHIVLFTKKKLKTAALEIDQQDKKNYLIYGVVLIFIFLMSPTMDQSDPYGPHFQLRVVFWLLITQLVVSWLFGQWKLIKQLHNEKTQAELMHLKSQVNPHFLFNTLNNLYGLAREKSDETPGLILKLSDMLRYTIYQGKKDKVKLSEEINYLEDFIQLQEVRYFKQVNIQFEHQLKVDDCWISPLLLIILLENAYKHGVEKLAQDAFVNINLAVKDQGLTFRIENNYDQSEISDTPGIGLDNLRRRLKLVYPKSHQLEIKDADGIYTVQLAIKLD